MPARQGKKGRKVGRQSRWHGVTQPMSAYRQRRMLNVPKGGDGGRWRSRSGYTPATTSNKSAPQAAATT